MFRSTDCDGITLKVIECYVQPGDSTLDIGGGPGNYTIHFSRKDQICEKKDYLSHGKHLMIVSMESENTPALL